MQVIATDLTIADIDEALGHLRLKLQDRYGNRLTHAQREFYLDSVNDLLDARIELTGGDRGNKISTTNSANA